MACHGPISGLDLQDYLNLERQRYEIAPLSFGSRDLALWGRQKKLVFEMDSEFSVGWEWFVPLDSPASLVLHHFKDLGTMNPLLFENADADEHWPFNFSNGFPGPKYQDFHRQCSWDSVDSDSYLRVYFERMIPRIHNTTQRGLRREKRRADRDHKLAGFSNQSWMPGAWIP